MICKLEQYTGKGLNKAMINNKGYLNFIERVRLLLGIFMIFSGLYFGLFSVGIGESLGLMSVLASPFVMVADK